MKQIEEPLVSITIPTYNRPDYLKLAIKSAIEQTYRNLEIIVSDNGSPVSVLPIIESFNDSRIRFHRYEVAVSMFENHIGCFKMATGKYVASLHDDDMWAKDFLEKMIPPLEANPELIVSFCNQWVIDEHGMVNQSQTEEYNSAIGRNKLKQEVYKPFMGIALRDLAIQPASSAVIRREDIRWDEISPKVGAMWDVYLSYLLAKNGKGAYFTPEKLTLYRIHSQSETGKEEDISHKMKRARNQMNCYEVIMEDERNQPFLSADLRWYIQYRWQHASTSMGIALLKGGEIRNARQQLRKSLSQGIFDIRTWTALIISLMPQPSHKIRSKIVAMLVKAH